MDTTKSIEFVKQNGSILERARLAYLLEGAPPPENVIGPLLRLQNSDGGFPSRPRPGSLSAVDSTLTALWQLHELGMFALPPARRAVGFLVALQSADGGWDENPALPRYDLPPWIQPGDVAAYWLALALQTTPSAASGEMTDGAVDPAALQAALKKAADFLTAQQEADGKIPGYLHSTWIGVSALRLAGPGYAHAAEKGLQYLASRPFAEWDDSQIAWALDQLAQSGLAAGHPFLTAALAELERRQRPDGSWASEDGPAYAASATVSALKAIKRLTSLPSQA